MKGKRGEEGEKRGGEEEEGIKKEGTKGWKGKKRNKKVNTIT